jgi:glutathione S-transferase
MKLYSAPGTSALGIRILLEEIGRPYEVAMLDFSVRQQCHPAFIAINPKSTVPTLIRDDGTVLTEFGAIARWLSRIYPEADGAVIHSRSTTKLSRALLIPSVPSS